MHHITRADIGNTWFHSTTVPDWFRKVSTSGTWVHAGSRLAALDRAGRVTMQGFRITTPTDLYTLRLDPFARVRSVVIADIGDDWGEDTLGGCAYDYDVLAYRNEYEDFGSLSILASPGVLRVLRKATLSPGPVSTQNRAVAPAFA